MATDTRRTWRRLGFQLLVFLLVAVNVEAICQYRLRVEGYETEGAIAVHDTRLGWRLKDSNGLYVNDGVRGHPILTPDPSELRVLCLGGSVTFGTDLAEADTWPAQLEVCLRRALPTRRVHVYNAGLPGAASHQYLDLLNQLQPKCEPQIVIVMLGINESYAEPYRGSNSNGIVDAVRDLLYHSATYRYLLFKLRGIGREGTALRDPDQALVYSDQNVRTLVEIARARGFHLLLAAEARREKTLVVPSAADAVNMPGFVDRVRGQLAKESGSLDVAFIDMTPAVNKRAADEAAVYLVHGRELDPNHYTPLGARLAAEAIFEKIKPWLDSAQR